MPSISNRGLNMPASPIRKLVPFANAAKARGIKVYHLNIGQPDILTPECGLDAAPHLDRKILEYSLIVSQTKADSWRFESARERYNLLLETHPEIIKRAPLAHIASYLLMTPETLSRVRSGVL